MPARVLDFGLAMLVIASAACSGATEREPTVEQLTARPVPQAASAPTPTPTPSVSPSPSPSPSPSVSPAPSPTGPTAADKARYAAAYAPAGSQGVQHVALDLDADGGDELLFTYIRDHRSRVDIAAWDGSSFRVVASGSGGEAQRIERVRVGDINADGRIEVVTFEADETGSSLTVFAVAAVDRLVGLRAHGGCYDGSATYGVVGAELRDEDGDGIPEIVARCDDSPLPVNAWSEESYRWADGAYRVVDDGGLGGGDGGDAGGDADDGGDGDDGKQGNGQGRGRGGGGDDER